MMEWRDVTDCFTEEERHYNDALSQFKFILGDNGQCY